MASKRNKGYIFGIAVALLLPLFSWIILRVVSKGAIQIPKHYGIELVDTITTKDGEVSYDTIYHAISNLQLTNQLGHKVALNTGLRDKILILNFFDTRNKKICPIIANNIHLLQESYEKHLDWIQIISITANPDSDNVSRIRAFADKYKANHDHWWLLTGDKEKIDNFAKNELHLPLNSLAEGDSSVFSQIILVDTFRNVRGYFNGLDTAQMLKLLDDVSILSMERPKR